MPDLLWDAFAALIFNNSMKYGLFIVFACCALYAQGKGSDAKPQELQPITSPRDERVILFREMEAKAAQGDKKSLEDLGLYFRDGKFPAIKSLEKAKEYWLKGASLGDCECARHMHWAEQATGDQNDRDQVVQVQTWYIIFLTFNEVRDGLIVRPEGVSESSWKEARSRAATFLAGVAARTARPAKSK